MSSAEYDQAAGFPRTLIPAPKPVPTLTAGQTPMMISSYPPLSQVTQIRETEVKFWVLLEVDQSLAEESWQVALWHAGGGSNTASWTETVFQRSTAGEEPVSLQGWSASTARLYFTSSLRVEGQLRFTVKFRQSPDVEWRWVKDEQGADDGIVIETADAVGRGSPSDLSSIIHDLNPSLKVRSAPSQCPGTELWSIETTVPRAVDDISSSTTIRLGLPWGKFLRWFALIRIWSPWLAPRHGKTKFALDKDGILCSFLNEHGQHLVLLAMSGLNDTLTVFQSGDDGNVMLKVRNDSATEATATVLAAVGTNFESANATVMYHARSLGSSIADSLTARISKELSAHPDDVRAEWMENWFDGLGYCTWNALGQRLTDEKIFKAVDTLAKSNIKITNLIIDDNWQSIDYRGESQFQHGWKDFEAEPRGFPQGLKKTVEKLRKDHPNIQHVAVWHALLGYWGGISPEGKLAQTYKTIETVREDSKRRGLPLGGKVLVIAKEDMERFYDDAYRFLSSCVVDGVKTDAQFMIDTWESAKVRRELIKLYQDTWTISGLRYFSNKVISCMSQTPQIMLYSQLPSNRPAVVLRNSDDYFPEIPDSHPWHIWTNAHNSLFTQHLNVLPDWDMFQTVHDYSSFHAAARCLSGGPIYVTDVPGEHNMDLIGQMTGITPRGKTVIFRPSVLGRAIHQYVGYHDNSLLLIGSFHGAAGRGTSFLGVFNISPQPLADLIPLASFPGVHSSQRYIVRAHTTGLTSRPLSPGSSTAILTAALGVRGYEILSAYPLITFDRKTTGQLEVCNLGLVKKMTGAAAIVRSNYEVQHNGRILLDTSIKALGVLGVYISTLPEMDIDENFIATIQGQVIPPKTVTKSKIDQHILEVDIETAWNEMKLKPGWANEVQVKLFFDVI